MTPTINNILSPEVKTKILIVDDDLQVFHALKELFCDDYIVIEASTGQEAIKLVESDPDIMSVVLDIKMSDMDGIATGRKIRQINSAIPIIFHTGHPGDYEEDELDNTEKPFDYVVKGRSATRLIRSVRNAVESHQSKRDKKNLFEKAEISFGMIGRSTAMHGVFRLIQKVSASDTKVVILGETGTGKELVARAIHSNSNRMNQKFGIVNCNHKSTELVEAELFGYKKGAFTGAQTDRKGLFEIVDGGTIFLDEIGDLSSTTQIALLRILETGEFQQIGPEAEMKTTDVRIICATHRILDSLVEQDQFREDLYYRLRGITITLPPLRERKEDIPLLSEKFRDAITIEQGLPYKTFTPDAINILIEHNWPGNVRELKDTIESLIVLTDSELIVAEDISKYLKTKPSVDNNSPWNLSNRIKQLERTLIIQALVESNYNITAAATLLETERSNLSKKIKNYGINVSILSKNS